MQHITLPPAQSWGDPRGAYHEVIYAMQAMGKEVRMQETRTSKNTNNHSHRKEHKHKAAEAKAHAHASESAIGVTKNKG